MSLRHHAPVPNILITVLRSSEFVYAVFFVATGVAILRLTRTRHVNPKIGVRSAWVRHFPRTRNTANRRDGVGDHPAPVMDVVRAATGDSELVGAQQR
jgi:hypothetical protein